MKTTSQPRQAARGLAVAGLFVGLAGCADRAAHEASYVDVRIEADAPSSSECREAVAIRFEPVALAPAAPSALYQKDTYSDEPTITGAPVEDGPGNFECWFEYRSRDLAPGRWRIVGEFANGSKSCVREVSAGRITRLRLDQGDGCVDYAL